MTALDVYHFRGYTRSKLEYQLDDIERKWENEKEQRIELQVALKEEQKVRSDLHWELKTVKQQLEEQMASYKELKGNYEEARKMFEEKWETEKQLTRDKKFLQAKVNSINEQCTRLEETTRLNKQETEDTKESLQVLRREKLVEEEKEQSFSRRQLSFAQDRIKELQKKYEERERSFEIERARWASKQGVDANTVKRVQFEREQAQQEVANLEQKLLEKRRQLEEAYTEIEKLEDELKDCDDEIRVLHARVIELEQEKASQKRFFESQAAANTASMNRESAEYVKKIQDLDAYNKKLLDQLSNEQRERDAWRQEVQTECHLKLQEMKMDLELERDNNKDLTRRLNEERRNDKNPATELQEKIRKLQYKKENLEELLQELKKNSDKEKRMLIERLEEAIASLDRLRQSNELLQIEKKSIESELKAKTRGDVNLKFQRRLAKLEGINKRLQSESQEWKSERERLILAEQQVKASASAAEAKIYEKVVELEGECDSLKKQIERLDTDLLKAGHEIRESKAEIEHLSPYPGQIKELKAKITEMESLMYQKHQDARKEKSELEVQVKHLTGQIGTLKEKFTGSEKELVDLKGILKRSRERERVLEDERRRLITEVEGLTNKIRSLDEGRSKALGQAMDLETDLQIEMNELKQELKERLAQAAKESLEAQAKMKAELRDQRHEAELAAARVDIEHQRALKIAAEDIEKWKKNSEKHFEDWQEAKKALHKTQEEVSRLQVELKTIAEHSEKAEGNFALLQEAQNALKAEKMKNFELLEQTKNFEIEKTRLQKIIDSNASDRSDHDGVISEFKKRADDAKNSEMELRAELEAQKERLAVLNKEKAGVTTQLAELDKENTDLLATKQRLASEKEKLEASESNLTKAIADLKEEMKKKDEESNKKEGERETKIGRLERELEGLKGQLDVSGKDKEGLTNVKLELEKQNKKLSEDLAETKKTNISLQNDIIDLKSQVARAKAETEKRATDLNTDIKSEFQKLIDARDARLRESNAKLEKLTADIAKKEEEDRKEQERRVAEDAQKETAAGEVKEGLRKVERELASVKEENKKLVATLNEQKKEAEEKERILKEKEGDDKRARERLEKDREVEKKAEEEKRRSEYEIKKRELDHVKRQLDEEKEKSARFAREKKDEEKKRKDVQDQQLQSQAATARIKKELEETKNVLEEEKKKRQEAEQRRGGGGRQSGRGKQMQAQPDLLQLEQDKEKMSDEIEQLKKEISSLKSEKAQEELEQAQPKPSAQQQAAAESADVTKLKEEHKKAVRALKKEIRAMEKRASDWQGKCQKLEEEKLTTERERVLEQRKLESLTARLGNAKQLKRHPRAEGKDAEKAQEEKPKDPVEATAIKIQSLVRGKLMRKIFAKQKQRFQVAYEVYTSETTYVESLRVAEEYYSKPLSVLGWISPAQTEKIFSNITEIRQNNSAILSELSEKLNNWNVNSTLGDVFVKNIARLNPHLAYVENFTSSSETLEYCLAQENNLNIFLQVVRYMPEVSGHSIRDMLILPVQRIPRYRLFLEDLLKKTPADHPDAALLKEGNELVSSLAANINENNRKVTSIKDWQTELCFLSGTSGLPQNFNRGLLEQMFGTTVLRKGKASKETVFLLTDLIAFGKEQKKRVSLNFSVDKNKTHHKIIETITLSEQILEKVKALESYEFPGTGSVPFVLQIDTTFIQIGDQEKLARWERLIKAGI